MGPEIGSAERPPADERASFASHVSCITFWRRSTPSSTGPMFHRADSGLTQVACGPVCSPQQASWGRKPLLSRTITKGGGEIHPRVHLGADDGAATVAHDSRR